MNPFTLFIFLMLTPFLFSCSSEHDDIIPSDIKVTEKSEALINSNNQFSFNLFNAVRNESDKNLMISPFSMASALSMALNGAEGSTYKAMQEVLAVNQLSLEAINQSYQELLNGLMQSDPQIDLNIANAIWIKENFDVQPEFISKNETYYGAEVARIPFDDSGLLQINNWASDETKGKIPKILDAIDPYAVMFIMNAIYFKGEWASKFDPQGTTDRPFLTNKKETKQVPTMHRDEPTYFASADGFSMVRLAYGREKFNMTILLPDREKTTTDVLAQLDGKSWDEVYKTQNSATNVDLRLPKFTFYWEKKLNDVLIEMGMEPAFLESEANFSGINPSEQLFISSVIQKTFVDVNEEGTEAAAVTSIGFSTTSIGTQQSIPFYVDRPFLFFITEEDTGAILFMGEVNDPTLN